MQTLHLLELLFGGRLAVALVMPLVSTLSTTLTTVTAMASVTTMTTIPVVVMVVILAFLISTMATTSTLSVPTTLVIVLFASLIRRFHLSVPSIVVTVLVVRHECRLDCLSGSLWLILDLTVFILPFVALGIFCAKINRFVIARSRTTTFGLLPLNISLLLALRLGGCGLVRGLTTTTERD